MIRHFTTSIYVLAKIDGQEKVLLHKHPKLKKWLPVGGHIEEGETPQQAALRETKEETNLDVILIDPKINPIKTKDVKELILPYTILLENIPVFKTEKAHQHIDSIFFAKAKNPKGIKMREEFSWFSMNNLDKLTIPKEVKYLSKKALSG